MIVNVPHLKKDEIVDKVNNKKLFGLIPRYGYLVPLVPFFPIMFLFTGSGGIAFFITALSEIFLR